MNIDKLIKRAKAAAKLAEKGYSLELHDFDCPDSPCYEVLDGDAEVAGYVFRKSDGEWHWSRF